MKLSRYSDYTLRVCLYLATHTDRFVSIPEIVEAYGLPRSNVMKLASDMVSAGIFQSLRGRSGGLRLARPRQDISVGDIVRHTEGGSPLVDCSNCVLAPGCGLIGIMAEAKEALLGVLDKYSLQDVLDRKPADLNSFFVTTDER